jgi:Phage integrase, N-terminal SAM-like domain
MARRRYQHPVPERHGKWWTLRVYRDHHIGNQRVRRQDRIRLGPSSLPAQEIKKVADEYLRPMNQNLAGVGAALTFGGYVSETYIPTIMPLLAKSTQDRYQGIIDNYLLPTFANLPFFEITPHYLQRYLSTFIDSKLQRESIDKIRDVMASILQSAVDVQLLTKNAADNVRLPRARTGRKSKPYLTP